MRDLNVKLQSKLAKIEHVNKEARKIPTTPKVAEVLHPQALAVARVKFYERRDAIMGSVRKMRDVVGGIPAVLHGGLVSPAEVDGLQELLKGLTDGERVISSRGATLNAAEENLALYWGEVNRVSGIWERIRAGAEAARAEAREVDALEGGVHVESIDVEPPTVVLSHRQYRKARKHHPAAKRTEVTLGRRLADDELVGELVGYALGMSPEQVAAIRRVA